MWPRAGYTRSPALTDCSLSPALEVTLAAPHAGDRHKYKQRQAHWISVQNRFLFSLMNRYVVSLLRIHGMFSTQGKAPHPAFSLLSVRGTQRGRVLVPLPSLCSGCPHLPLHPNEQSLLGAGGWSRGQGVRTGRGTPCGTFCCLEPRSARTGSKACVG